MLEYGVTQFDNSAVPVVNRRALENLIAAESFGADSTRQLQQLIDLVPQQMFIFEFDGGLSYTNRAAREYLVPVDAVSPAGWLAATVHPEDLASVMQAHRDAAVHGISVETDARVRNKDGEYRWFREQLFPLRDGRGHTGRWCAMRIDIQEWKESAQHESLATREVNASKGKFEEIVGAAPRLQAVLARVAKVAGSDTTVLITGETGTGKELIARAIHKHSNRSHGPFVSVNCAAIPRDLIASELFGHEKGAFTGALQRRIGRFELAAGGALFLDEIGELPAETQVALLRVLQEREFQRIGGNQTIKADVRIIVATHRDLPAAMAAGTFRCDLFYRINVFPLEMPPLRERKEDIRPLAEHFIERYASKSGKTIQRIERKSLERLQSYSWPGNIRELQNVIERSVILCDTEIFSVDPSWLSQGARSTRPLTHELISQEKDSLKPRWANAKAESRARPGQPQSWAFRLRR